MPELLSIPNVTGGLRQQRAAQIKAELETAAAEAVSNNGAHRVQDGETLESIARLCGQSPDAIWDHPLNQELRERRGQPTDLQEGDVLCLPGEEDEDEVSGGPVGQGNHVVRSGECISSIAKQTGHFWETIWNDSANTELREVRGQPNVLLSGDRVTIPEIRPKQEPGETETRHRFVRRGEPAFVRIRVMCEDEPRANEPYILTIDGEETTGTLDADGMLDIPIRGNASKGILVVGVDDDQEELTFDLGQVDPITELSGVQGRLANIGYECGLIDGELGPRTKAVIKQFQRDHGLEVTGRPDAATRRKLQQEHGS